LRQPEEEEEELPWRELDEPKPPRDTLLPLLTVPFAREPGRVLVV
jgi:hypothetical protein